MWLFHVYLKVLEVWINIYFFRENKSFFPKYKRHLSAKHFSFSLFWKVLLKFETWDSRTQVTSNFRQSMRFPPASLSFSLTLSHSLTHSLSLSLTLSLCLSQTFSSAFTFNLIQLETSLFTRKCCRLLLCWCICIGRLKCCCKNTSIVLEWSQTIFNLAANQVTTLHYNCLILALAHELFRRLD